jgi:hypothetical protein
MQIEVSLSVEGKFMIFSKKESFKMGKIALRAVKVTVDKRKYTQSLLNVKFS